MFLPQNVAAKDEEAELRKKAYANIETWSLEIIPEDMRGNASVSVQEVQCGDPMCAPIDTAVTIVFQSGCNGIFGLPMEAKEVTKEELEHSFPTKEVLGKWNKGEDAEWPPMMDPGAEQDPGEMPTLRFTVGTRVQCRIGPDATKDWASGSILLLWYREPNWPPGSFAPYKIKLDDGREIFAPADMDQVIRKLEA